MRRLLVLLVVVASFSCGTNPAQPSGNLILVSGEMGPNHANIYASVGGNPLTGAQVRVNGTRIPEVNPAGNYIGDLPALLAPGADVKLEIISGADTVTIVAKIPAVPVIVAPVAGARVDPGTPLAFSWTDTLSPDEFELLINYLVGTVGHVESFTAAGSARSGSVVTTPIASAASSLTATLYAYNNGTFTGAADPASRVRVRQTTTYVPLVLSTTAAHLILVSGNMSVSYHAITISRDGSPLRGAQVRVNGTTIPEYGPGNPGFYQGGLAADLLPGASVTLEVIAGTDVVTGVTTVPAQPTLVAPVEGNAMHPGSPVAFSWTATSNPDEFFLSIGGRVGDVGYQDQSIVAGSARSGSVLTTSIPATATNLLANIFAVVNGTFTGPADPASRMGFYSPTPLVHLVQGLLVPNPGPHGSR